MNTQCWKNTNSM